MAKPFDKRVEDFNKELDVLLGKYNFLLTTNMEFPQYRELPDEVKLAINILNNHKVQLSSSVIEKTK